MKIVARLKTISEIHEMSQIGVDAFLLDTFLATKKIAEYDLDNLVEAITEIKKHQKKVYLLINKIIHEDDLEILEKLLSDIEKLRIDSIVINDLTVYVVAKKHRLENLIIYQPGTYNTNSFDLKYFDALPIKGITLSKEITLSEIEEIASNNHNIEISIVGHGYLDMFYSKRKLLKNYAKHKNISNKELKDNYNLSLNEEIRKDERYPIFEDYAGTHIFRSKKLCSFSEFEKLQKYIDDFFIERIFIQDEEYFDAIKVYKNKDKLKHFQKKYEKEYDSGFYYKFTEKVKGELNES